MTTLVVSGFSGMTPKVSPRLLGESNAQVATNCDFRAGSLGNLLGLSQVMNLEKTPPVLSMHRHLQNEADEDQYWFHWTSDVDVVTGLQAEDTEEFTYFTGDAYPKMTFFTAATTSGTNYPVAAYQLGTPEPSLVPTATVTVAGTGDDETRYYVFTYVAKYLSGSRVFEGPPSTPVAVATKATGSTVQVGNMGTSQPSGLAFPNTGNYAITHKRIYRTLAGSTEEFFYVGEVAISSATFDDNLASDVVAQQGVLNTTLYDAPPVGLEGLIAINNSMLAGFDGNDWYCSELNQPHAWPRDYRKSMESQIVAHRAIGGNAVVVATKTIPHVISGSRPEAMSREPLSAFPQACVSKRSMVSGAGGAWYASPDGLCLVGPGIAKVVTEGILTRAQWQAYKPDSMHAYWFEGLYIAFFNTGTSTGGIIYDPATGSFYTTDVYATAGYVDPIRDTLYLAVTDAGVAKLKKWGAGSELTKTWRSRQYQLRHPMNLGWARVIADTYPLTFKTIADGTTRTYTVSNANEFALHAGFLAQAWAMEVTGGGTVHQMAISDNVAELAQI